MAEVMTIKSVGEAFPVKHLYLNYIAQNKDFTDPWPGLAKDLTSKLNIQ